MAAGHRRRSPRHACQRGWRRGVAMQPGTGRILTTHSGSLPRPSRFLPLVLAREAGEPLDEAQFTDEVRAAVRETVRLQADTGVDVLNDGEMSKPSYATYVKDRLTGFGGAGNTFVYQDLVEFPNLARRVFGDP